jgi:hypothetical protein
MEDQRILHYFISTIGNFQQCSTPAQIVQPINTVSKDIEETVDPNQISLLDAIVQAESEANQEADQIDEDIRYAANEAEERVLTEDELAHQLYGVDNDIEVSIAAVETEELSDEEEVIDELEVEELTLEQPEESILQYTDKDGNTFESIEFHNAAVETSSGSDFDLDFNETETEADNASDFF